MSWDALGFLYPSLLACLILAGMHAWLGMRIVERGVVFAGLALPQLAALGTTLAFLAGWDLHSWMTYAWSLGFAIVGAVVLTWTRASEPVIAIHYAVATGAAILAISQAPEGAEHLKEILSGNLLTVSKHAVAEMAAIYAAVAVVSWRKRSDFVLYASLAVAVTSSVAIAGVLVVFAFLLIPAVTAMRVTKSAAKCLAVAWTFGAVVSAIGVVISFRTDLPTGATVVCAFGIAALAMLARRSPNSSVCESADDRRGHRCG